MFPLSRRLLPSRSGPRRSLRALLELNRFGAVAIQYGVGNVVGYRIVQAYYDNADDKDQAVRAILGVTDYPAFLERSGYAEEVAK